MDIPWSHGAWTHPPVSAVEHGTDLLVTANPGCLMQVTASVRRTGGRIGTAHTVEVLDASLRGIDATTVLQRHRRH